MDAGQARIERRHVPRAWLRAVLPLDLKNGWPLLPEVVLWALNLQAGDLLTVEETPGLASYRFQSYLGQLESLGEGLVQPWPYIESMLRQPMAAVGPSGTLLLPENAAALLDVQRGALILRADLTSWHASHLFELKRTASPPSAPEIWVEREHTLPILFRDRVTLPAEVLWLLGLPNGGRLACETSLGEARYEAVSPAEALGTRSWVDLPPHGDLVLPASLRALLADPAFRCKEARLTAHLSGFRITLLADPGFDDFLR